MDDVGLVGYGSFGRLLARHVSRHARVLAFDPAAAFEPGGPAEGTSLERVGGCGVVVLAVPASAMVSALRALRPHLRPGALVLDVCSVKVAPTRWMLDEVPAHAEIVGTHPLFGPQTARERAGGETGREDIRGLPIALCPVRASAERLAQVRAFLSENLGLDVIETTPDEHDRAMALVQGLTHFLGHAAARMGLPDTPLGTLAYRRLLQIKSNIEGDSEELFLTIQRENPYAAAVRRRLMESLAAVEARISGAVPPGA